ncbi:MAG: site-specific DNA-methyltransferase [Dehalococcoidales bacterium]|nr:site-specific DNA-methyltransferase [Dehalococcoidales bacterium]
MKRKNHDTLDIQLNWPGKSAPNDYTPPGFKVVETIGVMDNAERNRLYLGDNKNVIAGLLQTEFAGRVKLIYIDPPFGIGSDRHIEAGDGIDARKAYTDKWGNNLNTYLQMMQERLSLMKDLLTADGSIYVHLDYHTSHYIKIIMDELFGRDNLVNQIIWQRTGAHNDPLAFGRNYDIILFYQKSAGRIWNKPFADYDEAHLKRYFKQDADGLWFRLNNPAGKGYQDHTRNFGKGPVKPPRDRHWSVTQSQIDKWLAENRIVYTGSGYPFVKKYLDELPGKPVQSIWTDLIPPRASRELTGFPTQKPEKLLERIIKASSNPGDLVADFFCGSGTTLVVAEKLGRRWLGCDSSGVAVKIAKERLLKVRDAKGFEVLG